VIPDPGDLNRVLPPAMISTLCRGKPGADNPVRHLADEAMAEDEQSTVGALPTAGERHYERSGRRVRSGPMVLKHTGRDSRVGFDMVESRFERSIRR
jgi:hypothetical protein